VSERQRRLWGLPSFPGCSGTGEWAKDKVFDWLDKALLGLFNTLGPMDKDQRERSKGNLLLRKLKMLKELLQEGLWYVEGTNIGSIDNPPHLDCRPVNPKVFAPRLLGWHKKIVLMSATIGDVNVLAEGLGLESYEFRSYPHNIPAEQRPVYLADAPAMSWRSKWKDYEEQADVIAYICLKHPYERILIHTTRWKHAKDLADRLARKGLQDRVWVPDTKKQTRIEQVAELTNPQHPYRITISPSFWEGLDYRSGSVAIIAKVPFQDRSDPVVATRIRQEGGNRWDKWVAALKCVQGCGRVVRDAEDYAVSYICDGNWSRVSSFAPAWFNVVK
jgi:Rad3-related DNA helicase